MHKLARSCVLGLLLVIGLLNAGCQLAKAIGSNLGQCELGQLPAASQALVADVSTALMSGDWQAELEQLSVQVGAQQLGCVVQAVVNGLKARLPAHGQADPQYLAAIERGQLWLAEHSKS